MAENMAATNTVDVDFNKSDGKQTVAFSSEFIHSFDANIASYDDALNQLQSLVNGKGFEDEYGICNCRYEMWYITPKDISQYISDLLKAISMKLITCDVSDLEKFSVEIAKRFISQNTGNNIEPDNIFASSKYFNPETAGLMDLLVETENTFFDRCTYSKYEMIERAKKVKPDYDKLNAMHFAPTMKAVVKSLPSIIEKTMKDPGMDRTVCCNCDVVMTYIETFILFACSLNTCIINQIIGYCEPMTTYLRKEKPGITQESVSTRGNKPVYVVLVSGTNIVSNTIKKFTHSKWSHAAISFDPSLEELYSYTFATTEYAPASQGLRRESIKLLNNVQGEVCVYGFYAPNKTVNAMKEAIKTRIISGKTKYDLGLLIKKAFNDNAEQSADNNKKICSAFVNSIIKEFVGMISDKNSPSPDDMSKALEHMPANQFTKLYEGPCITYDAATVTSHLKKFAKDAETKTFSEYVSEFCLIKTNDINIRSRIPFDFNMRNIVLQDCTPNFKDTKSAIHFMLKDNRSPIHAMLIESASTNKMPSRADCTPAMQMFAPYFHGNCGQYNGPFGFEYEEADFHTDVNWLDKIAYGNNFLDGNYRMDGVGNQNRHPIYQTLCMLHKMYCGCNLKTNTEISDNILKIAGIMLAIVNEQPWCCYNKELVKDILAVLGECFTRNVIKLYNNHCTIVTYSDDMSDTMIPGYAYCEAFVYMEAPQPGEKAAPPKVTFQNSQSQTVNTYSKNGALNKVTTVMRQFSQWITTKLAQVPALFDKINGAKANYVAKHTQLNQQVATAIQGGKFRPILQNFPAYHIPLNDIVSKVDGAKNALDDYLRDQNAPLDVIKIKTQIYPGNDATAKDIAKLSDPAKEAEAIKNYVLFGQIEPKPPLTGPMSDKTWNDICSDLSNSARLVQETAKAMVKSLQSGMKVLESIRKKEEAEANKPKTHQESFVYEAEITTTPTTPTTPATTDTTAPSAKPTNNANNTQQQNQQPQKTNTQQLFDIFQTIAKTYQINVINAITNTFFNTYYGAYREIIAAYNTQSKNVNAEATATPVAPTDNAAPQGQQNNI